MRFFESQAENLELKRIEEKAREPLHVRSKYWSLFAVFFLLFAWAVVATEIWRHERTLRKDSQDLVGMLQTEQALAEKEMAKLKGLNVQLSAQLIEKRDELSKLGEKYQTIAQDFASFKQRYKILRRHFRSIWQRYKELKKAAGAQPFSLPSFSNEVNGPAPSEGWASSPHLKGTIARVNSVYQFAIVNLGKNQGISEGDKLFVVRDALPLEGRLQVERVYDDSSACTIVIEDSANPFQTGDTVVRF